jgi:cysteinyl-tRNA synthetase
MERENEGQEPEDRMRLYDSLEQRKRGFAPRDGDHVTMYFCGPTVYNYIHLGNARPFVVSLVAKRYFEALGWRVTLVENITDIDDRIIQRALNEERTTAEVAEEFARAYIEDTDRLGLGRPDVEPKATEHIPEIIGLIESLVERGHAYQSGGDVYFDVPSFEGYGRLSKQNTDEMLHGVRIVPGEDKRSPLDFAVWKGAKPGEPAWESPWGPGRPGWHIECSAMSLKYLHPGFDIHGGGRDLIFPHHENELAQAEGALDQSFVRFWVHNGMLNTQTEKMSKSLGNIFLLREALKEYAPETLIMYFMSSQYRSPMEFSRELLEEAAQQVERLRNLFRTLDDYQTGAGAMGNGDRPSGDMELLEKTDQHQDAFMEALADDLNTAGALGEVFALAREINTALHAEGALSTAAVEALRSRLQEMLHILGLDAVSRTEAEVPAEVVSLAEQRRERRQARDFAEADRLREEIRQLGYEVRDVGDGFKLIPL